MASARLERPVVPASCPSWAHPSQPWVWLCTGLLYSGKEELAGLTCKDVTKCRFFEDGWYHRVVQALPGWTNLSEIGA